MAGKGSDSWKIQRCGRRLLLIFGIFSGRRDAYEPHCQTGRLFSGQPYRGAFKRIIFAVKLYLSSRRRAKLQNEAVFIVWQPLDLYKQQGFILTDSGL